MTDYSQSILELLEKRCPVEIPMHMPGHKRNTNLAPYLKRLSADIDITEIDGFDNLPRASGILMDSMKNAAKLYGSFRTFFMVNGSTGGILSAVHALTMPGDTAIIARNCHMSVFHAVALRRLKTHYIDPGYDHSYEVVAAMSPYAIEKALIKYPNTRLVVVTSPTYEGVISDIAKIAEIVHAHGAVLLVDEAHGSHLDRSPYFTGGAINAGADIVVHSLHKTLPSLTQTAIAHVATSKKAQRFVEALEIYQSTSPSYLLLASIDACIRLLIEKGDELFLNWHNALNMFDERIVSLNNLSVLCHGNDSPYKHPDFFHFDAGKLFITTLDTDLSGPELMDLLRKKHKIEAEMASSKAVLCMTGLGDTEENLIKLADALIDIDKQVKPASRRESVINMPSLEIAMTIAEAEERPWREISLAESLGQVSAEYIMAYPPGVPLSIPGAVITEDTLSCFELRRDNGVKLKFSRSRDSSSVAVL
ncbi:MAG TPA: aminotransferase class V-fold PLP-dependent enzyme [Christensenellaceae bacterium]|nr:aminotransferase class V-fold PLP-dependent enzyme [Christensenellaceae bacterium]